MKVLADFWNGFETILAILIAITAINITGCPNEENVQALLDAAKGDCATTALPEPGLHGHYCTVPDADCDWTDLEDEDWSGVCQTHKEDDNPTGAAAPYHVCICETEGYDYEEYTEGYGGGY